MENTYWHKQSLENPLYPDLIWSRPQTKATSGKLLLIGGNSHSFNAVSEAYSSALQSGAGTIRIIFPDSLKKTLSVMIPDAIFVNSTPSGSLATSALAEILENSEWADVMLLAGDLGRNSETSVLIEKLLTNSSKPVVLARDALDIVIKSPEQLIKRKNLTLVITIPELQTLIQALHMDKTIAFGTDTLHLVEFLHNLSKNTGLNFIIQHLGNIFVAVEGQVSTTHSSKNNDDKWRVEIGAKAAVWWMQNSAKIFEALTTSIL